MLLRVLCVDLTTSQYSRERLLYLERDLVRQLYIRRVGLIVWGRPVRTIKARTIKARSMETIMDELCGLMSPIACSVTRAYR